MRAVENAVGVRIPANARIIRNLLLGAQFQHDHIVHFYHLQALDWIDLVNALEADPKKTAVLSENVGNSPWGGTAYYRQVQARLRSLLEESRPGLFANAYWGHPAYRLAPEADLMVAAHYLEALRLQAKTARMHAVFGGKNPHLQTLTVGGVTCARDLTPERLAEFFYLWKETQQFIRNVYLPDVIVLGAFYKSWWAIGGASHFHTWGEFPESAAEPESLLMPRGVILERDLAAVKAAHPEKVTEHVAHAWYEGNQARRPSDGRTAPRPGPYDTTAAYSWLKAPRYDDRACEVGPLSRVLVAYARGMKEIKEALDDVLAKLDLRPSAMFSTLGRTAARCIETLVIGDAMERWLTELAQNLKAGDTRTYQRWAMPRSATGRGLNDVPGGSLGHWIGIESGKIDRYQIVAPATWNLGPRCARGKLGPLEEALIGTPVEDPKRPLEVLRTVHSLGPCVACGVH